MESPYNGKNVNGNGVKPNAWYCDLCGGYFTVEDAGLIGATEFDIDVCRECNDIGFLWVNEAAVRVSSSAAPCGVPGA